MKENVTFRISILIKYYFCHLATRSVSKENYGLNNLLINFAKFKSSVLRYHIQKLVKYLRVTANC